MTSRITGTGSCLAGTCVTNDWLSGIMEHVKDIMAEFA